MLSCGAHSLPRKGPRVVLKRALEMGWTGSVEVVAGLIDSQEVYLPDLLT